jgi:hypothetical protein
MKFLNSTQPMPNPGMASSTVGDSQTQNPLPIGNTVNTLVGERDIKISRVRMGG